MSEAVRLNKYIAMCGVCSRRDADVLIEKGKVYVNGKKPEVGCKVFDGDEVIVNGVLIKKSVDKLVIAYNKPVGVTCSEKDEHADRLVTNELKLDKRVTYAGRLDRDSEGLLIMTDDGDLIEAMMRGSNKHEKEYIVTVDKPISDEFLKRMSEGIYLKELKIQTRPCKVVKKDDKLFSIVLTQGLNRQIRRMCASMGMNVRKLKRVRVMNVKLGNLKPGEYREITGEEKSRLYKDCGIIL